MFIMHTKGNLPFVMHVKYFYRTVPHQQKHKIWTSQRCGFPETCNSEHILKSNGIKRSMSFCTLSNFSFLAYSGFDHDRNEGLQARHFTRRGQQWNGDSADRISAWFTLHILETSTTRPPKNSQFKFMVFFFRQIIGMYKTKLKKTWKTDKWFLPFSSCCSLYNL